MNKTFFWISLVVFLGLSSLENASALSITPGRTEVHLLPGQHMNTTFMVLNDHQEKMQIDVSEKNWFLYKTNKDISVNEWLKIHGKTHFNLKPGQSRKVSVTVSCPSKAEGLLVGMASFKFRTETPGMVTPMISVSIYLSVDGTQHATGEIKTIAARIWQKNLTVGAQVTATGNVHLRPSGTLTVLNDQGIPVADFRVNQGDPVYPGQVRGYTGVQQGEAVQLAPGNYVLKAHLLSGDVVLDAQRKFQVFGDGKIKMEGEDKAS